MLKQISQFLLFVAIGFFLFNSCGATHHLSNIDKNVTVRDSLVIRDSTRLVDSIIFVPVPREKVMDIITQIDTSRLETSVAKSSAYIDTLSLMIVHSLENKDTAIKERIVYQDRFITKTEISYRDSLVVQKVPVEVEVEKTVYPKTYWWLLGFFIVVVVVVGVRIYLKFKLAGK